MRPDTHILWLVVAVALVRAFYSWHLMAAAALHVAGMPGMLGLPAELTLAIASLTTLQLIVWFIYISGYTIGAALLLRRMRLAVPVLLAAAGIDITVWVISATDELSFLVTQYLEIGWTGVRDLLLNLGAIAVIAGVLYLRRQGALDR